MKTGSRFPFKYRRSVPVLNCANNVEEKKKPNILVHGSRQHLAFSFVPSSLRCHTLVALWSTRQYCSMYLAALCRGPIDGCCAVLEVHVDTALAVVAWFVPSWCAQKKQVLKPNSVAMFVGGHG